MTKFNAKNEQTNAAIATLRGKDKEGKEFVTIDEHGSVTVSASGYGELLTGLEITEEELKKAQVAQGHITSAIDHVVVEKGYPAMKANKELKSVSSEIKIGHHTHNVSVERTGTIHSSTTVPLAGDNGDLKELRSKAAKLFEKIDG